MPEVVPSAEKRLKQQQPQQQQQQQQQQPNQRQKTTPTPPIPKSAAEAAAAVKAAVARTSAARKQPLQPLAKAVSLSMRSTPQVEQQQQQLQQQRRQRALGPSTFSTPAVTFSSVNTSGKGKWTAAKSGTGLSLGSSTGAALWLKPDSSQRRLGKKRKRVETGGASGQIDEINSVPRESVASAAADAGELACSSSLWSPAPRPRMSVATHPQPSIMCRLDPKRINLAANNSASPEIANANNVPSNTAAPADANTPAKMTPEKGAITPTVTPMKQPAAGKTATADDKQPSTTEESNDENDAPSMAPGVFDQNPVQKICRRLRRTLNPRFQPSDLETIENNMHLIKIRKHPTQLYIESQKLMERGVLQDQQMIDKYRLEGYLSTIETRKSSKNAEAAEGANSFDLTKYPEWIDFRLRIKRDNAVRLWNAFVLRRKVMGKKRERGPAAVKPADKYNEKYIDVWTRSLTVRARPTGLLEDIVRPVYSRLGLDNRADFQVNVGNFPGDKRAGFKVKFDGELSHQTPVKLLYERGLTELFISPWPGLLNLLPPGYTTDVSTKKRSEAEKQKKSKEGEASKKKEKKTKNQSNERLVRSYAQVSQQAANMKSSNELSVLLAKVSNFNATRRSRIPA